MTTTTEVRNALTVIKAVADAIKEAGEIPSGTLYAMLMQHGCSLSQYEKIIDLLTCSTYGPVLVIKRGDLLIWNGES